MATPDAFVPVAVTRRSNLDESVHFGAVVALGPSGDVVFAMGDPSVVIYPRSSNKPLQTVAMVRSGLRLDPDLLALVCASHDGTPSHVGGVRRILAGAGLDDGALANTADLPLEPASQRAVLRAGGGPTRLQMNCSGKHSGMLATCVRNGWVADASYLDVDHPVQRAITATIDDLAGETHAHIGVDGCGAPAHAFSLIGLARAFRAVASSVEPACRAVYDAMTQCPDMVGGERQDTSTFMRHIHGLMAKDGAEGVFAAALPNGSAVALKIADGGQRARPILMVAALRALGVDVSAVEPLVLVPIMGHGRRVGEVRALVP